MESAGSESLNISTICLAEIEVGIELQPDPNLRVELAAWLSDIVRPLFEGRIIPVSVGELVTWRLMGIRLSKTKRTIPEPDLLLAATARHHGLVIASRNTTHSPNNSLAIFA